MIISHSKKFIFVRGQKIAGESIEMSLARYLSPGDITYGLPLNTELKHGLLSNLKNFLLYLRLQNFRIKEPALRVYKIEGVLYRHHVPAKQVRELVGKRIWEEYFTFTFERNPWDRMISLYFWKTGQYPNPPTFKEFVDAMDNGDERWLRDHNLDQYLNLKYYTINGEIAVDYIGQYENLNSDLQLICKRIGIPFDGWLPFEHAGTRPKEATQEKMYDKESMEKMKRIFSREISLFGYKPDWAK